MHRFLGIRWQKMPVDTAHTTNMDFIAIFGFTFFSIIAALLIYFLSFALRYKTKEQKPKNHSGCALSLFDNIKTSCQPQFFVYVLCFLLFEAQCVLLLPFACVAKVLDIFSVLEIMIFILIMIFSTLFITKSDLLR